MSPRVLALFDVDGTLTVPRKEADDVMKRFMEDLRSRVTVGIVGGSDLVKISEQLGEGVEREYAYLFSENGLVAYKDGALLAKQSLKAFLGEDKLKRFINFVLHYVADLDVPVKRGTFIEFRAGMLNVSPIGSNCSPICSKLLGHHKRPSSLVKLLSALLYLVLLEQIRKEYQRAGSARLPDHQSVMGEYLL